MSEELCEMSLRQTQDLLLLTDRTLQNLCCRRFTGEELYLEALQQVLGGEGKRGPAAIFMTFPEPDGSFRHGRLFNLTRGKLVERLEVEIDPLSTYARNLGTAEMVDDMVISNWGDSFRGVEEYQQYFSPTVKRALGVEVHNFVTYRISGEHPGLLVAFNYPGRATVYDASVLRSLAIVIGSLVTLSGQVRETEQAFIYTIEALARACEAAEEQTGQHILRVNRYAGALAANIGAPVDFVETIAYSAQMHDVGKIRIPATILLKEGPLDEVELELMKMHPVFGEQILGSSPRLQIAREIAIAHHENWDGSGYPYGLKGARIPLSGRIVKIADVYDALRSRRSYKAPYSHADAVRVFREGDRRIRPAEHFDPELLAGFFRIEHLFEKIYESSGQEVGNHS
jgi:HD-GYP domain-containing protein (c-di-GMP phosphodiesterase class II)